VTPEEARVHVSRRTSQMRLRGDLPPATVLMLIDLWEAATEVHFQEYSGSYTSPLHWYLDRLKEIPSP
jgi:hypothetical protein